MMVSDVKLKVNLLAILGIGNLCYMMTVSLLEKKAGCTVRGTKAYRFPSRCNNKNHQVEWRQKGVLWYVHVMTIYDSSNAQRSCHICTTLKPGIKTIQNYYPYYNARL